ncbi:MAG: T9SS type A sorting domain-containing protein [Dysgonomonas sp.]
MKKLFTTCALLICMGASMQAQVLATFEDSSTDLLVKGDKWYEPSLFEVEPEIGTNADKSGLNVSNTCFKAVNVADADWWGNFGELKLKTPITITESNHYLKFMAYRSIQPKNFRIAVNGDQEAEVYYGKLSTDGKWQGVVADLSSLIGKELTSIVIVYSCNWADPRTGWGVATYMFDNFELSNDAVPPGETVVDPAGFNINFESQSQMDKWVNTFDMLNEENSYQIIDNPYKQGVDLSAKVVQFNKSGNASWWQGFRMVYNGLLDLGINKDNKYLHTMVYIPQAALKDHNGVDREGIDVMLCAKDFAGKENTYTQTIWNDEVDMWMDLVMEVNQISYLKELTIRFDVLKDVSGWINSPANTFYLDDIAITDSYEPRTEVQNSGIITSGTAAPFVIRGLENVVYISGSGEQVNAQIYNVSGALLKNISFSTSAQIPLQKGAYIVKVKSGNGFTVQKVLVK